MDYRISERAMVTSCAVGILIVMLGNRRQSLMMSAVGAAVMVLGILQALVFYKCPHCKKRFKIGSRRPNVCPYCGAKLEDDQPAEQQTQTPAEQIDTTAEEGAEEKTE